MTRSTPSAAILVGGYGRRLGGVDKSRLIVGGRSIIVRQLDVLQRISDDIFVVGREPDRFADLGVHGVVDVVEQAGAIGGIYTAVTSARHDAVIVVGCDLPFLDQGLLDALVDLASGHDGAWVRSGRGIEPLFACYRKSASARIQSRIEAGQLKAADLGASLDLAVLTGERIQAFGDPERLLANVNTPADVARIESMAQ
jgi:molybdopterin-guanine dinucleotide biosynthesis protein A